MCGISSVYIKKNNYSSEDLVEFVKKIVWLTSKRGKDGIGIFVIINKKKLYFQSNEVENITIKKQFILFLNNLKNFINKNSEIIIIVHSRLKTNGEIISENIQPIVKSNIVIAHNGIIVGSKNLILNKLLNLKNTKYSDTFYLSNHLNNINFLSNKKIENLFNNLKGSCTFVIYSNQLKKIIYYTNNGSLYFSNHQNILFISSENNFNSELEKIFKFKSSNIIQVVKNKVNSIQCFFSQEKTLLNYENFSSLNYREKIFKRLKQCKKCILNENSPFISFNINGVCNYCLNTNKIRNNDNLNNLNKLNDLINKTKITNVNKKILLGFSGGKDSLYALDVLKKTKNQILTFTYDWSIVSDIARKTISLACQKYSVENIICAESQQLQNQKIRIFLDQWIKNPDPSLIILTMFGDKKFFKFFKTIKKENNCLLTFTGGHELERTNFKSGLLGINTLKSKSWRPYDINLFEKIKLLIIVFIKISKNLKLFYHLFFDLIKSFYYSYFFNHKHYRIFDFISWDYKKSIKLYSNLHKKKFDNEIWRNGDPTTPFYNFIYFYSMGICELDFYYSNLIRSKIINKKKALKMINKEKSLLVSGAKKYCDLIGYDFTKILKIFDNLEINHKH